MSASQSDSTASFSCQSPRGASMQQHYSELDFVQEVCRGWRAYRNHPNKNSAWNNCASNQNAPKRLDVKSFVVNSLPRSTAFPFCYSAPLFARFSEAAPLYAPGRFTDFYKTRPPSSLRSSAHYFYIPTYCPLVSLCLDSITSPLA